MADSISAVRCCCSWLSSKISSINMRNTIGANTKASTSVLWSMPMMAEMSIIPRPRPLAIKVVEATDCSTLLEMPPDWVDNSLHGA